MVLHMYNSNKISAISFIACMMIVLIHVVDKPYKLGIAMLTQWAVPWFLIVSGYFFSKTLRDYNLVTIVRKKVNSLAIPYLLFGFGGG